MPPPGSRTPARDAAGYNFRVNTGYNTDVKHKSRVFHIQTEDKGQGNPSIESLVYVGGEILATRRTSYAQFVKEGRDDHAIQELMDQQHRTMIAAIQRGRFDGPDGSVRVPEGMSARSEAGEDTGGVAGVGAAAAAATAPAPSVPPAKVPPPRVPPPGVAPATERSLDQVILDFLTSEANQDQLEVTVAPTPDLVAGRPAQLRIRARSSVSHQPVTGAVIQIRILTTVGRPLIVFNGKTGSDGGCAIAFAVPQLKDGNAAAVLRVSSPVGSMEFKYPVKRLL